MNTLLALLIASFAGSTLADLPYKNPWYRKGRSVMVHLFEWKWEDIAEECERFLGPKGYGGVQISPANENLVIKTDKEDRPWYERYQPISYQLITRSGDETAFRNMVDRCNKAGIRIYADVIINHMAARVGVGTAGNKGDSKNLQFPAVPYSPSDFNNPTCGVIDFNDPVQVRNCGFLGLPDLNQGKEYVRQKIVEYLNKLIDIGVAGFRVDAAKHMWPEDLHVIYSKLRDLNTTYFPKNAQPYIYHEVVDYGMGGISENDYVGLGAVLEFRFGVKLTRMFQHEDIMKYLANWGEQWGFAKNGSVVVFVDNHDSQRGYAGPEPIQVLSYKSPKLYKGAIAFMLAHPYGEPNIMSSYDFQDSLQGPPHFPNGNLVSPSIRMDDTCGNNYICEHRWRQIYQMVKFRNVVRGTGINRWWDNRNNQISFCRGNKGFIVFNNEDKDLEEELETCLPDGIYCDIISGSKKNKTCTGKKITVGPGGRANISLKYTEEDMMIAIHLKSRL